MNTAIHSWDIVKESYQIIKSKPTQILGRHALIFIFFLASQVVIGKIFLLGIVISTLFTFCLTLFAMTYVENGTFTLDTLLVKLKLRKVWYFFLASFASGLAVAGGLILLIIPGIIASVALRFVKFIALDQDITPRKALSESVRITKGSRAKILEYMVIAFLINIAGFLCLVVGVLFTMPLTLIGFALIYKKLKANAESSNLPENTVNEVVTAEIVETA